MESKRRLWMVALRLFAEVVDSEAPPPLFGITALFTATNYLDLSAATNAPAFYYRLVPSSL